MANAPQPQTNWQAQQHCKRGARGKTSAADEIGHWARTVGILAPLVIGELVSDPDRKWRFIRITSVAAAIFSEGFHLHKTLNRERERARHILEACALSGLPLQN